MSKTKKTRPLYVRLADKTDKTAQIHEVHDHRDGKECTLPPGKVTPQIVAEHEMRKGYCYYSYSFSGVNLCGCPRCTAQSERKQENRKNRHEAKNEAQRLKNQASTILEEVEELEEESIDV